MVDRRDDDVFLLALIALLANGGLDDGPYAYELLHRLRMRGRFRELLGPDLEELFEHALRRPRRSYLVNTVERIDQSQKEMRGELNDLRRLLEETAADLYDLYWLLAVRVDIAAAHVARHVPARLYFVDRMSEDDRARVIAALDQLLREVGFELAQRLPDEEGSWWKRLVFRTKSALTHDEVQSRLKKAERAVEAHYLAKPEAEANNLQASGAAALISALKETDNAAIQVGSLLVIKATNRDGKCVVLARTLTPDELKRIEENQAILREPEKVLEFLGGADPNC